MEAASHDGLGSPAAAGYGDAAKVWVHAAEQEGLLDGFLAWGGEERSIVQTAGS